MELGVLYETRSSFAARLFACADFHQDLQQRKDVHGKEKSVDRWRLWPRGLRGCASCRTVLHGHGRDVAEVVPALPGRTPLTATMTAERGCSPDSTVKSGDR